MSHRKFRPWPITLVALVSGLAVFLLLRNLTTATPRNSVWLLLSKYRRLAKYIEAQARHESKGYTSEVFKRANNPFGMKHARERRQLGERIPGDQYRHYRNIGQAIRDYLIYLESQSFPTRVSNEEEFVSELRGRGYFEDSEANYLTGIKRFLT